MIVEKKRQDMCEGIKETKRPKFETLTEIEEMLEETKKKQNNRVNLSTD